MFDVQNYIEYTLLRKIEYVSTFLNLKFEEIAEIIELDSDFLKHTSRIGSIPDEFQKNEPYIFERLCMIISLFNYLLKMSKYDERILKKWWEDPSFYKHALVKPPWYSEGFKAFLSTYKFEGLKRCLKWIKEN